MNFLLLLLYFLLPFERIPTFEVGGFTVKLSYIVAIIILTVLLFKNKIIAIFRKQPLSGSEVALLVFWTTGASTIYWSVNFKRSIIIIMLWAFVFLIYAVISRIKFEREKVENIILISTLVVCFFGIYQFIGDSLGLSTAWTGLRYWYTKEIADLGFPRIQSVALEPLYFSNFLLVPFYLTLKKYLREKMIFGRYFWLIVLISVNVVLGISRGAYYSLLLTLILLIFFILLKWKQYKKYKFNLLGVVAAIILSIVISYLGITVLNGKDPASNFRKHAIVADADKGNSVVGRREGYIKAWQEFQTRPLFGIGVGNFGGKNSFVTNGGETKYDAVNNIYLEILSETGIMGFTLFALFVILLLGEFYKFYKGINESDKLDFMLLFLGILAIFIQYNFFSTLYIIYVWAFLALLNSYLKTKNAQ